jgi:hypothetical protein|nr:hypothetical protein [Neorhizobium tomejilense]
MLIEFTVPLITVGKPARTKDHKTVLASVKRQVEVPEYSASQAPLAVRCRFGEEDSDGDEIECREYREIDGSLYVDVTPDILKVDITSMGSLRHSFDEMPCIPPFQLVGQYIMNVLRSIPQHDRRTTIYPSEQASKFAGNLRISGPFPDIAKMKLDSCDEGMIEHCLGLFDEAAAGVVFIDGRLHAKERPPVIQVAENFSEMEVKAIRRPMPGTIIRYADEDGGQRTPFAYFRIDQAQEALDLAAGQARKRPGRIKVGNELGDLFVAPEAPVDFNSSSAMVYAMAVAINDRIVDFSDQQRGRYAIALLAAVLESYQVLERELQVGEEENVSDDLVQAVETIMAGTPEVVEYFVGDEDAVARCRIVLDEWHDRPLALEIGSLRFGV